MPNAQIVASVSIVPSVLNMTIVQTVLNVRDVLYVLNISRVPHYKACDGEGKRVPVLEGEWWGVGCHQLGEG